MNDTALWLRKSIWDVRAAAALLLGFIPIQEDNGAITINLPPHCPKDPRSRDWHAELQAICDQANDDIDADVLPHLVKRKERRIAPVAFARWAIDQGYAVPAAWQTTLLSDQDTPRPPDNPSPAATETPSPEVKAEPPNPATPKDKVTWQAEMLERWEDITGACKGRPTTLQTMEWLKKNGSEDVFPRDQKNRYSLQWIDAYGDTKTVTKKTVDNVLSRWRKAGMIPA